MDVGSASLTRIRHHLRRPLARTPFVWDATMLVRTDKRLTLARRDTAIVMEGFSRSGNTFAAAAFMVSNGRSVHIGRHLHGAPHLLRAARLGVPAVALIRDPRDAVLSYVIRRDQLTPADALIEYVDFYRTAWRARDSFVVGAFERVTHEFGAVIDAVNQRFGTDFSRYEATPDNDRATFSLVEQMNREECHGEVVESQVGRPSPERTRQRLALEGLLEDPSLKPRLDEAQAWYQRYLERVDG
jgi:hypothetical protein